MTVQYYRKNVYGTEKIYMIDTDISETIQRLIGQITISESQIEKFKKLGMSFEETFAPRI